MLQKIKLVSLLMIVVLLRVNGQDLSDIKRKPLNIERQGSLSDTVYKAIADNQLFMIGENHGTNEPATLVISLAELFTKDNNKSQVGIEIPTIQMKTFLLSLTDYSIYSSEFFTKLSSDIRPSYAWADMIASLNRNHNIELFFFDVDSLTQANQNDRDSLMYVNIKKRMQLHPNWKTITISGNIHSMLLPYHGEKKMAMYLYEDKDLNISSKILSIRHTYGAGSLWDNAGSTPHVYETENNNSSFAKLADYNSYLFLYPENTKVIYNGIYFTRKVTVSKMVRQGDLKKN